MATLGFDHSIAHDNFGAQNTAKLRPSKKIRQRMRKRTLAEEAKKMQVNDQIRKSLEVSSQRDSGVFYLNPLGSSTINPCLTMTDSADNERMQYKPNEENESKQTLSPASLCEDNNSSNLLVNHGAFNGSNLNDQKIQNICTEETMTSVDKINPTNPKHDYKEIANSPDKPYLNSSNEMDFLLNEKQPKQQIFNYDDGKIRTVNSVFSCLSSTRPLDNKEAEWEKTLLKSKGDLDSFELEHGLVQNIDGAAPFRTAENSFKSLRLLDERSQSPDSVLNSKFNVPDFIYSTDEETNVSLSSSLEPSFDLNQIKENKHNMVSNKKEDESSPQKTEKILANLVSNRSNMKDQSAKEKVDKIRMEKGEMVKGDESILTLNMNNGVDESLLEMIRQEIAKNADHVADNGLLTFPKHALVCSFNLAKIFLYRILA